MLVSAMVVDGKGTPRTNQRQPGNELGGEEGVAPLHSSFEFSQALGLLGWGASPPRSHRGACRGVGAPMPRPRAVPARWEGTSGGPRRAKGRRARERWLRCGKGCWGPRWCRRGPQAQGIVGTASWEAGTAHRTRLCGHQSHCGLSASAPPPITRDTQTPVELGHIVEGGPTCASCQRHRRNRRSNGGRAGRESGPPPRWAHRARAVRALDFGASSFRDADPRLATRPSAARNARLGVIHSVPEGGRPQGICTPHFVAKKCFNAIKRHGRDGGDGNLRAAGQWGPLAQPPPPPLSPEIG